MGNIHKFAFRLIASSNLLNNNIKILLWRKLGLKIGKKVNIGVHVYFDTNNIKIGNYCTINTGTSFITGANNLPNSISIGENVQIGPNCNILAVTHEIGSTKKRAGTRKYKAVKIKSGSWLGGNVTILPGVTIAESCVIAAGSVVTKSTEPNGLYAGVPAVRKRDLEKN